MATKRVDIGIRADPSHAIAGFNQAGAAAGMFQNTVQSIGASISNLGRTVGIFTAVAGAGVVAAAKQAIGFESQVGDAGRALNLTSKELEDFRKLALETAPPLGLLPSTFAEFATEAGKLGVAKEDIKDFSLLVAQTNAATDAGAVSIAQHFAAIKAIYNTSTDDLRNYAATLNALDDQVGGSFATISEFVSRVGSSGKLVGLSENQLAALGATYAKLGVAPERAATAINSFISRLSTADSLSDKARSTLGQLGYTSANLHSILTQDFGAGMNDFFDRIRSLPTEQQLVYLTNIFGRESADELATLVAGFSSYQEALDIISQKQANLNKLDAEQQKRLHTTSGQINVFQANVQRFGIAIGSAILPPLNEILSMIIPVAERFAEFAEQNPKLIRVGVAIGAVLAIASPLLIVAGGLISSLSVLAPVVGFLVSPFALLAAALAGVFFYLDRIDALDLRGMFSSVTSRATGFIDNLTRSPASRGITAPVGATGGGGNTVNINFQPVYNLGSIVGQAVDTGQNILGYIKRNDRQITNVIQEAVNRLTRSIF